MMIITTHKKKKIMAENIFNGALNFIYFLIFLLKPNKIELKNLVRSNSR